MVEIEIPELRTALSKSNITVLSIFQLNPSLVSLVVSIQGRHNTLLIILVVGSYKWRSLMNSQVLISTCLSGSIQVLEINESASL